jgi:23S rRNA-intervening sequence protein
VLHFNPRANSEKNRQRRRNWFQEKSPREPHLITRNLDLLLLLVEAAYSAEKTELLERANRSANGLRYLLRLAKDLRLLSLDAYGFAAERLDEVGRMIGGWGKSVRSRK